MLGTVMQLVHLPQKRVRMLRAMKQIFEQIRHQQHADEGGAEVKGIRPEGDSARAER